VSCCCLHHRHVKTVKTKSSRTILISNLNSRTITRTMDSEWLPLRGVGWASCISSETVQADQVYWRLVNKFRDSAVSFYTFSSSLFQNNPKIRHCTACSVHHLGGLQINTNSVHLTHFNYREFVT